MTATALTFVTAANPFTLRPPPPLPLHPRHPPPPPPPPRTLCTRASYLSPSSVDVDFSLQFRAGNFGAVFLGRLSDDYSGTDTDIVVKCPVDSDLGRKLYDMERHTNRKLAARPSPNFPPYLGELLIPADRPLAPGLARLGLVWQQSASTDTLEEYLTTGNIPVLAQLLSTSPAATPLRTALCGTLLRQLAVIAADIHDAGIVHRDIKPDNLLISPSGAECPLQLIDFGSSCDWGSITKKGLRLATCDPVYAAPEKRLDIFRPAFRFDVYSVGLIALRAALPSVTDGPAFQAFVRDVLVRSRFSLERACNAVEAGRIETSPAVRADMMALGDSANAAMYSVLGSMLTESPSDRAEMSDCLRSRFVQMAASY